jgi:hypothetical protein
MSYDLVRASALYVGLTTGSIDSTTLQLELVKANTVAALKTLLQHRTLKTKIFASDTALTALAASNTAVDTIMSDLPTFNSVFANNAAVDKLINHSNSGPKIAGNDTYTQRACSVGRAAWNIVANSSAFNYWKGTPANYVRLQAQVNAAGSKLKSQLFTASGNWTPVNPLAVAALAIGGGGTGGKGGDGSFSYQGSGGQGAEAATYVNTSSVPASAAITVGAGGVGIDANGGSSSFGALLTAVGGATNNGNNGTTTNGGVASMTDTNFQTAVWQLSAMRQKGGAATQAGSWPGATGGTTPANYAGTPTAGTGICAGGGNSNLAGFSGSVAQQGANAVAPNYGSGGGGSAQANIANGRAGGNGAPGCVMVYWVEA